MDRFLRGLWKMFTHDGMYTTWETIAILIFSFLVAIAFVLYQSRRAYQEKKANMISDMGYAGYLRHKALMRSLGIEID